LGSPDIYPEPDREPHRSINFVTCHDGFTLNDLVSYNEKHNQDNGEDSRDGSNDNHSWNCGVEGPTDDPAIAALRQRQIKNFFTALLLSQGTPMLSMGDEVRRTQQGNNNAYCQNNELSWFDWSLVEKHADLLHFVRGLIHFMQSLELFQYEERLETFNSHRPYINWHGMQLGKPDWSENSRSLAFTLYHPDAGEHLHVIFNAYWEAHTFELPTLHPGKGWYRIVDTSLNAPEDYCQLDTAPRWSESLYRVQPRSAVILIAKANTIDSSQ
jgi:glycogen operon protein